MHNPFIIDEPTCISFSGGRTSAYMLWRILQANEHLPNDVMICFSNTGKEDEETLKFVDNCSKHWNVPITWLEWQEEKPKFKVVDFKTASRNGEPFSALNRNRKYLPNSMARYCTVELKVLTTMRYLKSLGWTEWVNMVGIRADEPRRVAKINSNPYDGEGIEKYMPLALSGITKHDVGAFWKSQPFDLGLPSINGSTFHGNCDLCYLKGGRQLLSLIKEKPERAIWWAKEEEWAKTITKIETSNGIKFRPKEASYAEMMNYANNQIDMFNIEDEGIACFCGD